MKKLLKKIDNKYVRLVAFIIVIGNASMEMAGYELLPFSNEQIVMGVSIVGIVIVGFWNYWKNNSFTEMAKQSDRWLESTREDVHEQKNKFEQNGR